MPGLLLHTVDWGRDWGVEIITPKSAMALKTDVHLSVIYFTQPVSTDKVILVCQVALLVLDCSPCNFRIPECPRMHHGSLLALHLQLPNVHLHVCLHLSG